MFNSFSKFQILFAVSVSGGGSFKFLFSDLVTAARN